MATLTFLDETFEVDHAVKGDDYIHGYDADSKMIVSFEGVSDFSGFIYDGTYMDPGDCLAEACNDVKYCGGFLKTADGKTVPNVTIYHCWTNSNIASSFAAQDIDTGITDGDLYIVTYAYGTTILAQKSVIAPMGKSARMDGVGAGTSSIEAVRTVHSSGGVLSFGSGYKNGAVDNSLIIPARIYVIKGVNTV